MEYNALYSSIRAYTTTLAETLAKLLLLSDREDEHELY